MRPEKPSENIKYKNLTLDPNVQIGIDSKGNPVYSGLIIRAYLEMKEKYNERNKPTDTATKSATFKQS